MFTADTHTAYAMIGAYTKAHPFKCEFLSLEQRSPPTALGQIEFGIGNGAAIGGARWPNIASEKACFQQLVGLSVGPWHLFLLDAAVEQTRTVMVNAMTLMNRDELQQLEVRRLARLHALDIWEAAPKAKNGAKARTKSARPARRPCKDSAGTDSSTDHAGVDPHPIAGPFGPDAEAPPPPVLDGVVPEAGGSRKRGIRWGNGGWMLAEIHSNGRLVGCGATCKNHETIGSNSMCKQCVNIGDSGLICAVLMHRLKLWLVAGLDDAEWDTDDPRAEHISMGGRHMQDFADGQSEAECDRLAHGCHAA